MCLLARGSPWIYSNLSILRGCWFLETGQSSPFAAQLPLPHSGFAVSIVSKSITFLVHSRPKNCLGSENYEKLFLKLHSPQLVCLSSSKAKLPSHSPIKNKQPPCPQNVQTFKVFQWLKTHSGRVNRLSISIMKWNIFKRLITFYISFLVQSCQYSRNIYLNGLFNLLVNNVIWIVFI